jgi:hypothetical protein
VGRGSGRRLRGARERHPRDDLAAPRAARGVGKKLAAFLGWQATRDDEDDEPAPPLSADDAIAIEAWNLANGGEWAAVPYVCEALGIDDAGELVRRWAVIRESQRMKE